MNEIGIKLATEQDLENVIRSQRRDYWGGWSMSHSIINAGETPWGTTNLTECIFGINTLTGFQAEACHLTHRTTLRTNTGRYWHWVGRDYVPTEHIHELRKDPMFVQLKRTDMRQWLEAGKTAKTNQALLDTLAQPKLHLNGHDARDSYGYAILRTGTISCHLTHQGIEFILLTPFDIAETLLKAEITEDLKVRFPNGAETAFPPHWQSALLTKLSYYSGSSYTRKEGDFNYTLETLDVVNGLLTMGRANMSRFLKGVVKAGVVVPEVKSDGIKKTWARILPLAAELMEKDPLAFCGLRSFAAASNRSVDGVKISGVFNEVFKDANTVNQVAKALEEFWPETPEASNDYYYRRSTAIDEAVKRLDTYRDKRKQVLKSQANRAFTKLMEGTEFLTIDRERYPKTWAEIEAGNLGTGTFFRKSEQYFLLNDNWALWEEMFKRGFKEQAIALASEVRGRTTYEKDLMSYFYFVLYALPEYLKKHTGAKWTCTPKLVNSSSELDPPKEDDDSGVVRHRSALTPIVDNEKHTVEVPYASLAMGGSYGTTYCYSHDYHVLTKGFSFNGNAVMKDLEEELNGRDDYGLMFYTLTGSAQGRGYPTFLIIFERRGDKDDTRVHFHRTHPSRSKSGDYNPIHNWIQVCYNWMAGNIRRDRIKAQQGDLVFVQVKTDKNDDSMDGAAVNVEFNHKVDSYDHHCFERPVEFGEYTLKTKSNILGYVRLSEATLLRHNEHDDVVVPAGTYAIHQCRSWEANPQGVWTLRID